MFLIQAMVQSMRHHRQGIVARSTETITTSSSAAAGGQETFWRVAVFILLNTHALIIGHASLGT